MKLRITFNYYELIELIDKVSLSKSLSKILRVSQEINDNELEKWIRLELHGYWNTNPALTEDVVVSKYRTVTGYYTDDFGRILSITNSDLQFVNEIRLRFGVVELEGYLGAKGPLVFQPLDNIKLVNENLKVNVSYYNIYPNQINSILEQIKTELSDRIVARKNKFDVRTHGSNNDIQEDVIELKPNVYGLGINLKALARKFVKASQRFTQK